MRSFTDTFIRHPVLAVVVNLVIVLVGWRAITTLPVQQYPNIQSSSVLITTVYYGASAETVRGFLTTPIERVVSAISGVDYVESTSRAGVSTITVHLKLNHNSTAALAEVTARLQQVRSELPAEAEPPVVEVQRADRPYASFYLSFTSSERDIPALTDWLTRNLHPGHGRQLGLQVARQPVGERRNIALGGREAQVERRIRPIGALHLDHWGLGLGRQLGAHLLQPRRDLRQGRRAVVVELQVHGDGADAGAAGRLDVVDPADRRHGTLDRCREEAAHRLGAGAVVHGGDQDRRAFDLRILLHRQGGDRSPPHEHDHEVHHNREDGVLDERIGE